MEWRWIGILQRLCLKQIRRLVLIMITIWRSEVRGECPKIRHWEKAQVRRGKLVAITIRDRFLVRKFFWRHQFTITLSYVLTLVIVGSEIRKIVIGFQRINRRGNKIVCRKISVIVASFMLTSESSWTRLEGKEALSALSWEKRSNNSNAKEGKEERRKEWQGGKDSGEERKSQELGPASPSPPSRGRYPLSITWVTLVEFAKITHGNNE